MTRGRRNDEFLHRYILCFLCVYFHLFSSFPVLWISLRGGISDSGGHTCLSESVFRPVATDFRPVNFRFLIAHKAQRPPFNRTFSRQRSRVTVGAHFRPGNSQLTRRVHVLTQRGLRSHRTFRMQIHAKWKTDIRSIACPHPKAPNRGRKDSHWARISRESGKSSEVSSIKWIWS